MNENELYEQFLIDVDRSKNHCKNCSECQEYNEPCQRQRDLSREVMEGMITMGFKYPKN